MFHRGFLERVNITGKAFIEYGPELVCRIPLRDVHFNQLDVSQCAAAANSQALIKVRELWFYQNHLGNEGLLPFLQTPYLNRLVTLSLDATGIDWGIMSSLGNAPNFNRLEELDLSQNAICDEGIVALSQARGLKSLRRFGGRSIGIASEAMRCFSEAPIFSHLEELSLGENDLDNDAIANLCGGKGATWCELNLDQNVFDADGVSMLAVSPRLANLRQLWCGSVPMGDEGAKAIARSHFLTQLTDLQLNDAEIGVPGIEALFNSPNLANVRFLDISDNRLGARGARIIADSKYLPHLRSLLIMDCEIGDEGCIDLMKSPNIEKLTDLMMDENGLTDRGAKAILDTPYLQRSEDITLSDDEIGDGMILKLRERFGDALFCYRPSLDDLDAATEV